MPPSAIPDVLVAADSAAVREEVKAVLGSRSYTVREVRSGPMLLAAVEEREPDLVVCDMQMGTMGGMAVTQELRLDESGGRVGHIPVLLLLDRRPDVFLARRSDAEGYLVKPLDPIRLRTAITTLLAGGRYEDASYRPPESAAAAFVAGGARGAD